MLSKRKLIEEKEKSKKVEKRLDLIRNKWYIISAFKGKGERETKKQKSSKKRLTKKDEIWYIRCIPKRNGMIFENWAKCQFTKLVRTNQFKQTDYFFWRVWSWLRMNAGGMPKTCKSNEVDQWRWSACTKLDLNSA